MDIMNIGEKIKKIIQDIILPELEIIKGDYVEVKNILQITNKRLDDINIHLVDQSRRIDENNKRIDELRVELKDEISKNTMRIDENNKRIDETNKRIDETNKRIDNLYGATVRREEHEILERKTQRIEQDIVKMKGVIQTKIAA